MAKVLIIEDDDATARDIKGELEESGFSVELASTGSEGLIRANMGAHDIIVVDRQLPHVDGLSIIASMRQKQIRTPVLVLSAMGTLDERVRGLRSGGDDYLSKPFALVELVARIEALLRRPPEMRETVLRVGPLELDLIKRKARRGTREITLLPKECQLLEYLIRHQGQLVTRTMLFEHVWSYRFVPASNLVDVHMGRLRHKVDCAGEAPMIQSIRGGGFQINAPQ